MYYFCIVNLIVKVMNIQFNSRLEAFEAASIFFRDLSLSNLLNYQGVHLSLIDDRSWYIVRLSFPDDFIIRCNSSVISLFGSDFFSRFNLHDNSLEFVFDIKNGNR